MSETHTDPATEALSHMLRSDQAPGNVVGDEVVTRFRESWRELLELGFEVDTEPDTLTVRHRDRGFEGTIHFSRENDLGELRTLFLALRRHFGRLRDRWMPWLFLPGQEVTVPYEHLRQITAVYQQLRQARATAA